MFYRNRKFSFLKLCCLCCISICVIVIAAGTIAPRNATTSSYDKMPNEFNAEDYQILEFENSICAIDSSYELVLNETNEKSFTYSLDDGNLEGIYLSSKNLMMIHQIPILLIYKNQITSMWNQKI